MQVIATMANRNGQAYGQRCVEVYQAEAKQQAARIAAMKQPVPVAVSQLKSKRAASGVAFCTTGAVRNTLL